MSYDYTDHLTVSVKCRECDKEWVKVDGNPLFDTWDSFDKAVAEHFKDIHGFITTDDEEYDTYAAG